MSQLNFSIGTFSQCMSFSPQNIQIDNFEDCTLYCIDCENVQQFDINTLNAASPSVFFFFGNFEKIGQKAWQQIFAIAKDFPNSYCFNTHQSQKNFADIYCATLLGQVVANVIPKKILLVTNDQGFHGIKQALMFQGKDIDIEILQTRDTFLLPLKEEQPKQVQKAKKQQPQTNQKPNEASDEEVLEALKKYPKINTRYASIDDLSKYLMPILANKQKKCKLSKWIESDYAKKVGRYKKDSKGKYYKLK